MPTSRKGSKTPFEWFRMAIAMVMVAVVTGSGCTREPQAPLRVGTHIWPGFEPLYLAREKGFYPAKSVQLVEYTAGSDAIAAFRAGAIDAEALTLDEALFLAETSPDIRIVLVLDTSNGGDAILTQSNLSQLRDLKGKRVGVETSALGAFVLTRALQTVDMQPSDVRTVRLESIEHERAFRERRVEAVVTYEPFRTKIVALGAHQVFDSRQIPGEIVDVLVVRGSLVAERREQISQLVRGWFKALDVIRTDRDQALSLMARREGLSAADFQTSLQGLILYGIAENRTLLDGPDPALLPSAQRLGQVMLDNRLLVRPPKLAGILDGSFVRDASP